MPKAYWIAHVNVSDPDAYEAYKAANAEPFAKYGARFLVRAGRYEQAEGNSKPRQVVIEFPDYDTAKACYNSPEYQAAKALRTPVAQSDMVIVEGWDG